MEYRKMENIGISTSLLGFGCMRFPTTPEGEIDEVRAEKMLDRAIAAGVNYIDTAYPYHGGKSEPFVGKALKKYPRDSFYLATKLPVWLVNSVEDAERIFNEQLDRLQTDHIDFYLLHAMNGGRYDDMVRLGIVEWGEKKKAEGKIKYFGFSFHDGYEAFEHILTARKWDFCQIQLNYRDTEVQAGLKGYALTEKLGVPLVIMEPVKGGSLTTFADDITAMFKTEKKEGSLASWALRFVGTLPNVKVVLSGMSTEEQVADNLSTFDKFEPLSEKEQQLIKDVVAAVKARVKNGCTNCRYCMPCPFGVDIPRNFSIWNNYSMYGNAGGAKWNYYHEMKAESRADQCKKCGACEKVCPQAIPIRDHLAQVHHCIEELK